MEKCARCGAPLLSSIMSRFNTDIICMPCETVERAHPKYPEAAAAELAACQAGNYNFHGIGCPPELYTRRRKDGPHSDTDQG